MVHGAYSVKLNINIQLWLLQCILNLFSLTPLKLYSFTWPRNPSPPFFVVGGSEFHHRHVNGHVDFGQHALLSISTLMLSSRIELNVWRKFSN